MASCSDKFKLPIRPLELRRSESPMFKRIRYQQVCIAREGRNNGPDVWIFRWRETQPDGGGVFHQVCSSESSGLTSNPRQQGNSSILTSTTDLRAVNCSLRGERTGRGQRQEGVLNKSGVQMLFGQLDTSSVAKLPAGRSQVSCRRGMARQPSNGRRNESEASEHHECHFQSCHASRVGGEESDLACAAKRKT